MKMIEEVKRSLQSIGEEKAAVAQHRQELETFQNRVAEMVSGFLEEGKEIAGRAVLLSLCSDAYSRAEKENAVSELKNAVSEAYDGQLKGIALMDHEIGRSTRSFRSDGYPGGVQKT